MAMKLDAARSPRASGALGLLPQAVHGLDEGVRSVVAHSPHYRLRALDERFGQRQERSSRQRLAQLNRAFRLAEDRCWPQPVHRPRAGPTAGP